MENEKNIKDFCRYFNNEDSNPYQGKNADKAMFWLCEGFWYAHISKPDENDPLGDMLDEYLRAGLRTYEQYDNVPITLKAVLFNRFCQYNDRMDIKAFKEFYADKYMKGGHSFMPSFFTLFKFATKATTCCYHLFYCSWILRQHFKVYIPLAVCIFSLCYSEFCATL